MKTVSIFFLSIILFGTLSAQRIAVFSSFTFQEPPSGGTVHSVPFYITDNNSQVYYTVFANSTSTGSAQEFVDFTVGAISNPVTTHGTILLTIRNNGRVDLGYRTIVLRLLAVPASGTPLDTTITIQIQDYGSAPAPSVSSTPVAATAQTPAVNPLASAPDTNHVSLSIITAASFDFFGQNTFAKYAGNINLHLPNIYNRWGGNLGISSLHYYTADTSSGNVYNSNVLLSATATRLTDTSKYRAATYALNSKTDYRTWSYYAQILYYTGKQARPSKDAMARFYLTLHTEAFSVQSKTTFMVDSIQNRVETYDAVRDNRKVFSATGGTRPKEIVSRRVDGYFGLGGSLYLDYPNRVSLFTQAIFGFTTSNPKMFEDTVPRQNTTDPTVVRGYRLVEQHTMSTFYMVRTHVVEKFTKLNASVGVDLRGMFPQYTPLIAAYLGFQLKFDDFFKK